MRTLQDDLRVQAAWLVAGGRVSVEVGHALADLFERAARRIDELEASRLMLLSVLDGDRS